MDEFTLIDAQEKINNIRPNDQRARLAQLLVWLVMVMDIVSIGSSYLQYKLLTAAQRFESISMAEAEANDFREMAVAILHSLVYIISAVVFIQWFRRGYYNMHVRTESKEGDGWAAGAWFVPIISWFKPYQIMKEMWDETTRRINQFKGIDTKDYKSTIVGVWWTLWVISVFVGNIFMQRVFDEETVDDFINTTIGDMVLAGLGVPLAIITVQMIKAYARKEEKLFELERYAQVNSHSEEEE